MEEEKIEQNESERDINVKKDHLKIWLEMTKQRKNSQDSTLPRSPTNQVIMKMRWRSGSLRNAQEMLFKMNIVNSSVDYIVTSELLGSPQPTLVKNVLHLLYIGREGTA